MLAAWVTPRRSFGVHARGALPSVAFPGVEPSPAGAIYCHRYAG